MKVPYLRCDFFVITVFFSLQLFRTGSSIRCYRCNSPYDGVCADPVRNNVHLQDCDKITPVASSCKKMTRYLTNTTYIIRDCTSQAETEDGEGCFRTNKKDDYCRCFTDACNTGVDAFASCQHWTTTLSALVAALIFSKYHLLI